MSYTTLLLSHWDSPSARKAASPLQSLEVSVKDLEFRGWRLGGYGFEAWGLSLRLRVHGLGFRCRVWGLGFWLGLTVDGLECRVSRLGFRVWDLGFLG